MQRAANGSMGKAQSASMHGKWVGFKGHQADHTSYLGVSKNRGTPKMDGLQWKTL